MATARLHKVRSPSIVEAHHAWHWAARADAYEAWLALARAQHVERYGTALARRIAAQEEAAAIAAELARDSLQLSLEKQMLTEDPAMKAYQAARLVLMPMPETNAAPVQDGLDRGRLTDEELWALRALEEKMAGH